MQGYGVNLLGFIACAHEPRGPCALLRWGCTGMLLLSAASVYCTRACLSSPTTCCSSVVPRSHLSSSWCAGTSRFWLPPCSLSQSVPLTHTPALQMLSGHLPFWRDAKDRNPLGIMTSILSEDIKFEGAPWDSISDDARDFVTRLLDRWPHLTLCHFGQFAQFCI